jgi:hypothetical protein
MQRGAAAFGLDHDVVVMAQRSKDRHTSNHHHHIISFFLSDNKEASKQGQKQASKQAIAPSFVLDPLIGYTYIG